MRAITSAARSTIINLLYLPLRAYELYMGPRRTESPNVEQGAPKVDVSIIAEASALILTRNNRWNLSGAMLLTLLNTTTNLAGSYLLGATAESFQSEDDQEVMGIMMSSRMLILATISLFGLSQLLPKLREKCLIPVHADISQRLQTMTTEHLIAKKSLGYHVKTPAAEQTNLVRKGFIVANSIRPVLTNIVPTLLDIAVSVIAFSGRYGSSMGLGMATTVLLYSLYSLKISPRITAVNEEMLHVGNKAWATITGAIGLDNYKAIHDHDQLSQTLEAVQTATIHGSEVYQHSRNVALNISIGHVTLMRVAMFGIFLLQKQKFSAQEFIAFFTILNRFAGQLPGFGASLNDVFGSIPDLRFVFNELATSTEIIDDYPDVPLIIEDDLIIHFNDLNFCYNPQSIDQPLIFDEFNLTLERGMLTALVSESGGGKSTLFNLLYRYYQPQEGSIIINSTDIAKVGLKSLRSQITIISQEHNLHKGTVRDNILLGIQHKMPGIDADQKIMELAERLGLVEFICSLRNGLDTQVGENGGALSGGQQQRVAILRGLLHPAPILLLDEITSALDNDSRWPILKGILNMVRESGMLCLMITHKLDEASLADRIVVLENGHVSQDGPHETLVDNPGCYQRLWQSEAGQVSRRPSPLLSPSALFGLDSGSKNDFDSSVTASTGKDEYTP